MANTLLSSNKCNNTTFLSIFRYRTEVDFVVQQQGLIFPIEVKAETNIKAKSFRLFCEKYQPSKAYRTSLKTFHTESWMENLPLYAIGTVRK